MPLMNRIRVNNVKYNFGTQQYDDFTMRLHGKNTIYDLANGGGKSVLMLLLLQNLIPNCTLDEKQPVEKLFRTSGGSKTIHSMIEWILDEPDIKDGYRYMTTGFCARKAKENESNSTAAIDYFNYCIFYRAYNDNDIVNLPLEQDGQRITYVELRNYIKELERQDPSLKVFLFERKGEYQHFISEYGLHESAWEIIRGINKTEGHVRTYFETNYKTTRKVVEDLLIEEIIEKSFRNKIQNDDIKDNMAKTLLEIKDKLVELSKKKQENTAFEHQKELLTVLSKRVETLRGIYEKKENISSELRSVYMLLKNEVQKEELELKKYEGKKEELYVQKENKNQELQSLKIMKEKQILQTKKEECDKMEVDSANMKLEIDRVHSEYKEKESVNDFLELKACESQKLEAEAMIAKSGKKSEDYQERLYDYAAVKKAFLEERLGDRRQKVKEADLQAKNLRMEAKAKVKAKQELECEEAVANSNVQRLTVEHKTVIEQLKEARKGTNLLLLEDVDKEIDKKEKETARGKRETEQIETEIAVLQEKISLKKQDQVMEESQLAQAIERFNQYQKRKSNIENQKEKYEKLCQIYKSDSVEGLKRHILSHYEQWLIDSGAEKEKESRLRKAGEALRTGKPFYESDNLFKVKEYLETRHEMEVYTGQEYLALQLLDRQEELLNECPILPYCLVVKGKKSQLEIDEQLKKMELGSEIVPVIFESYLISNDGKMLPKEGAFYVGHVKELYLNQETASQYATNLIEQAEKIELDQKEKEESRRIFFEDYEFILGYEENEQEDEKMLLEEKNKWEEKQKQTIQAVEDLKEKVQAGKQKLEDMKATQNGLKKELQALGKVKRFVDTKEQIAAQLKKWTNEYEKIKGRLKEAAVVIEKSTRQMKDAESFAQSIRSSLEEDDRVWEEVYKEYDKKREPLNLGFTEAQLDAEFKSMKKIVEKGMVSLEDKYALIKTLARTMERLENQIEKRGISCKELEKKWKNNELYVISENELITLSRENNRRLTQRDQLESEVALVKAECNKCQGRIELGLRELEEKGITFVPVEGTPDELHAAMDEVKNQIQIIKNRESDLYKGEKAQQKEYNQKLDSFKDIKRMVDIYQLGMDEEQKPAKRQYSYEELKECMHRFDRSVRKESKAREELEKYKLHTTAALRSLQAFELAEVIEKDMEMPQTLEDMEQLSQSLVEMVEFIELEQSRIEQGIQDMEFIKANFENQCIRRCQDVKTELDCLPKLSKIILDGETIQMIGLTIPYIKEEQYSSKMSDYIDKIVMKSDQYEDTSERMKFIRAQLSLKNLFSVIVTDMNEIKLMLYKRERMKEQSRYLRYEEAVGSTGQSQGIYIQFLVSIINYISNIQSKSGDDKELGKVIFIDNPFGAAKDVYIWEPIFELLKTNHVQLIVPARGATPAITGRFDVNYILGQKLVNGKQQTVVADYRSQVETQEMEYHKLDFAQESFDFV